MAMKLWRQSGDGIIPQEQVEEGKNSWGWGQPILLCHSVVFSSIKCITFPICIATHNIQSLICWWLSIKLPLPMEYIYNNL